MMKLEIKERRVYLDGVEIQAVRGYELKNSAEDSVAELTLRLYVEDSNIVLDKRADHIDSNLCQSV
jgi:hypothetical protein